MGGSADLSHQGGARHRCSPSVRLSALATIIGLLTCATSFTIVSPTPSVPAFADVRAGYRPSDVRLLDRNGEVIHELRIDASGRRLEWAPLSGISPALQGAVIASEDRRFHSHGGVDMRAVGAAGLARLRGTSRRGASTITMQLATLLDTSLPRGGEARTLASKWRQMRLAWSIERTWSKAEILEGYLNLVTFRGELQGAAAAASVLFDKAPHGLTEAEALVLAALLRAPNATSEAMLRRARGLGEACGGSISREQLAAAVSRIGHAPVGSGPRVTLAPHAARRLLGRTAARAAVRSTLDVGAQRAAAEAIRRHLIALIARNVHDAAVLVADNATGDVLAYVGGSGDLASASEVDGIRARRQAGSTLKPFLYGMALEQRVLTAASLLDDAPLEVLVAGGLYRPRNYDEEFRGLVSVRTALAGSLNVPAVRALLLVGPSAFAQRLRALGFSSIARSGDHYGLSLALGSADVTLWDLTNAYRSLANGGRWTPLRLTGDGSMAPAHQVYAAAPVFVVSNILADRESRSATFGLENPLVTRFWTAVKTGTSKDMRDNWCVGYSRHYTVGVWVGNLSGMPMEDVSGVTGAAPIWLDVMNWLHREVPSEEPRPPADVRSQTVHPAGGAEPRRDEWFLAGTEPNDEYAVLASDPPRILAPTSGTVITLDPDIPTSLQRVVFEAAGGAARVRWLLNGEAIGSANEPRLWEPEPGRYALALAGEHGEVVDQVTFEVRGLRPDPFPLRNSLMVGGAARNQRRRRVGAGQETLDKCQDWVQRRAGGACGREVLEKGPASGSRDELQPRRVK